MDNAPGPSALHSNFLMHLTPQSNPNNSFHEVEALCETGISGMTDYCKQVRVSCDLWHPLPV